MATVTQLQQYQPAMQVRQLKPNPALTFVLHDTGETRALEPVMQRLSQQGIDYRIIATSTADQVLRQDAAHMNLNLADKLASVGKDFFVTGQVDNPQMAEKVKEALKPKLMVTGMMQPFQVQAAQWAKQAQKTVLGFYDSFATYRQASPIDGFKGLLAKVMTPSQSTALFVAERLPGTQSIVTGQPTLESLQFNIKNTNPLWLKQQLGLAIDAPTLLWVGGWDSPNYRQAVMQFAETIKQLPQVNVLIAPHPKARAQNIEMQMLHQAGVANRVKVLPESLSTPEALPVADAVISQQSTLAMTSVLSGKPAFFMGQPNSLDTIYAEETSILGQAPLVQRYNNPLQLADAVKVQLTQLPLSAAQLVQKQQQLGIPNNAAENICKTILQTLQPESAVVLPFQPAAAVAPLPTRSSSVGS